MLRVCVLQKHKTFHRLQRDRPFQHTVYVCASKKFVHEIFSGWAASESLIHSVAHPNTKYFASLVPAWFRIPGICNTRTTSQFPQTNFLYYFYFLLFVRRQVFHCGYYSYPGDGGMFPAFLCIYFQNSFWYALKICKFWEYGKIWNCCRNSRQCSPLANQVYDVCLVFMSSKCAA